MGTDRIATGLQRLATVAHTDSDALISDILALLADSLHVGLTFLARVEAEMLVIDRVYDAAGMGLVDGTAVDLCDTY